MRLWLSLLVGLLCVAVAACPVPEEVESNTIDDANMRQADYSGDDAAAVCEVCGEEPCTCEPAAADVCEVCGEDPCTCEAAPDAEAVEDAEVVADDAAVEDVEDGEGEAAAVCEECGEDPCVCGDHEGHDH